MKEEQTNKISINYIFFGSFFFGLILFSSLNILLIDPTIKAVKSYFLFYSFFEIFIEISLIVFIAAYLNKRSKPIFFFYLFFVFVLFLIQMIDCILLRIMDLSIWEAFSFVIEENWGSFMELLKASDIPLSLWFVILGILILLPFLAFFLFSFTEKITQKKTLSLCPHLLSQGIFYSICMLFLWDFLASPLIHHDLYFHYEKMLPWKTTLLHQSYFSLKTKAPLHRTLNEKKFYKYLKHWNPSLEKKPNIYLFIVESLREDFMTAVNAPYLTQFKNNHIAFKSTIANANATQLSWFSIFFSQFPFFWGEAKKEGWQQGSPFLSILKKLGYSIHVYSASELSYYGMKDLLFGKNQQGVDSFHSFPHPPPKEAYKSDSKVLFQLFEDLEKNKMGNLFIIFLDSTHFAYSYPKEFEQFHPVARPKNCFSAFPSNRDLEMIKNRYRNAIFYIDHLFESFIQKLKDKDLYSDSIIAFMGDHGEEFFEHGHLFHASHLCNIQTHTPIYLKLGLLKTNDIIPQNLSLFSHIDIFPTIVHFLIKKYPRTFCNYFHGESIFFSQKWPYVISARFNASLPPYEFCIENGKEKLTLRFREKKHILQSRELELLSLKSHYDQMEYLPQRKQKQKIKTHFQKAFERLFASKEKQDPITGASIDPFE